MKIARFAPPGNIDDFATDPTLPDQWSGWMSNEFDSSVASVAAFLTAHGGGISQFYNPVTKGTTASDLPASAGDITWNGFPKRFSATGPGSPASYAAAEPARTAGEARLQDEYLEWFVNRNAAGKITSVHFTCEAWDYFEFLAARAPARVLELYRNFVDPSIQMPDLFSAHGSYSRLNKWNTALGAMHLTHNANNLFAEIFLAASATVRREQDGVELTQSIPLINCGEYGDPARDSDPKIGAAVNALARGGRIITLVDPVGLYIAAFDSAGLTLNGAPAGEFFRVVRGALPLALRAVYELPPELAATGLTVSDVKIGGDELEFGGQLAERITMHLLGAASTAQAVQNPPVGCGPVPETGAAAMAATSPLRRPSRRG
jgi:hypothetical protein